LTDWAIPREVHTLTASAQSVLFYCLLNCDEDAPHLVPGGVKTIALTLGIRPTNMHRLFDEIDAMNPRPLQRIGRTRSRAVRVSLTSSVRLIGCAICGDPKHLSTRFCPSHFQSHGRNDRAWKVKALEIYERGEARGDSNMNIAYAVHTRTAQPLWGTSEEGAPGTGSGSGEGIIPFFVRAELFPESMLRLAKRARSGGGAIDEI
jgi:hypothetical protein